MTQSSRPHFPFSALYGQPQLQTALLLAAIDPLLGGVLIEGPRGTAKSTSARALADLLPQGRFVNLPLCAGEEQLVGSLDIESALKQGDVIFKPGMLARAHQGVLYVDEVNLLADALVDLLLDVSASGVNYIERDGISHQHDAHIVLIGTMNPEEGELRPQLLDRFGLFVRLGSVIDPATRQRIVRARLQFDTDPAAFVRQFTEAQQKLVERIAAAQKTLAALPFSDTVFERVSALCHAAAVEGVRADLVMLRAARAHAALNGQGQIGDADIDAVAELVLAHRRHADTDGAASGAGAIPQLSSSQRDGREEPPAPGEPPSSGPDSPAGDWGGMPPEAVPVQPVKKVRPLHTKKR